MKIRWPLWLLPALLVVGCVPISAAEITATAQSNQSGSGVSISSSLSAAEVSRSSDASITQLRASSASNTTPVSTVELVASPAPTVTATPTSELDAEAAFADATATPSPAADVSSADASETATESPSPTATVTPTDTPTPDPAALAAANASTAQEALSLINDQRVQAGLAPLNANASLMSSAQGYAQYMAVNNFFGHTAPDGSTSQSRIAASGYSGACWGEALSAGQGSPQGAVTAWMNSSQHRAILLEPRATDAGLGYYYEAGSTYGAYWVLETGWSC